MKRSTLKRVTLAAALVATLIAAWFAPAPKEDGVTLNHRAQHAAPRNAVRTPAERTPQRSPHKTEPLRVEVLTIHPRSSDDDSHSTLFASTARVQAVARPRVATAPLEVAAPPPPTPPPLPLRVLGRYEEAGQTGVFLQYKDQNLVARLGDTVAEHYKVEALNGSTLTLRYLPLDQIQTLDLSSAR